MAQNFKSLKIWEDVFDPSLDEQLAPEIDQVVEKRAHKIYSDPIEFFKRTYFSESILTAIKNILSGLRGEGKNIVTLYSLFGGGKTHTLITLYHAFNSPESLIEPEVLDGIPEEIKGNIKDIAQNIENIGNVEIAVLYGKNNKFSGRPAKPLDFGAYKVHTLWGLLAHSLGRYDLMKTDDQNLTAPDVETIRKVIEGKSVLLLMDEILDYIYNLQNSADPRERNYANVVPSFLDRLSTALVGTRSVMVFTMQVQISKEGELEAEERYDPQLVSKLFNIMKDALGRVGASAISPLKRTAEKNDVMAVLKKRIFEETPREYVKSVLDEYRLSFENFKENIGEFRSFLALLWETAPFHPEYIRILENVIERADLQKTRDMLKFSRNVVRELVQREINSSLVMPWHIDILRNENIRHSFFSGTYDTYASVARTDIGENCKKFRNPDLAEITATFIFLKTYYFDNPLPQPGFPRKTDVIKGVFEPITFREKNWSISDILETLNEFTSSPNLIFLNEKDGIFWFWKRANINEQIEITRKRLLEESPKKVESKLKDYVKRAVFGERLFGTRKKGKAKTSISFKSIFKKENLYVTSDPTEANIRDDDNFKLVVIVRSDVPDSLLKETIYKIRDGDRKYKNTIVAVAPISQQGYENCMSYTARIMACDEVSNRVKILYGGLSKEVIAIQEGVVKRVKEGAERDLQDQIIGTFKKVAFPWTESSGNMDISVRESTENVSTIHDLVYRVLASPDVGKVYEQYRFSSLEMDVQTNMGIKLSESSREFRISEITDWYKTNPKFPMVEEESIKESLKEGVKQLKIGLSHDGKIWYKKVYEDSVSKEEEIGSPPAFIRSDYIVLPWKNALRKQIETLLVQEKDWIEGDRKISIRFYVIADGNEFYLKDLFLSEPEGWFELVKEGKILKKRIEKGIEKGDFEVRFNPPVISASPGQNILVNVEIFPVREGDSFIVKLTPELGTVEPEEGEVPFTSKWNLFAEEQSRSIQLSGESDYKKKEFFLKVNVISRVVEVTKLEEKHIGYELLELRDLTSFDYFKAIADLFGEGGVASGSLDAFEGKFKASIGKLPLDITNQIVQEVNYLVSGSFSVRFEVTLKESVKIDEILYHKLKIFENVRFFLKKPDE